MICFYRYYYFIIKKEVNYLESLVVVSENDYFGEFFNFKKRKA